MSWTSKDHIYPQITNDACYGGYYKYTITNIPTSRIWQDSEKSQRIELGAGNLACIGSDEMLHISDHLTLDYMYDYRTGTVIVTLSWGESDVSSWFMNGVTSELSYDPAVVPFRDVYNGGVFYVKFSNNNTKTQFENTLTSWQITFTDEYVAHTYVLCINNTEADSYDNHKINQIHYNNVDYKIGTKYPVTISVENGSHTTLTYLWSSQTVTVTVTPDSGYSLPGTISVTNALYAYNSSSGVITLSNATGNVSVSVECVSAAGFVQKFVTNANGYSTLSDMDTSNIYSFKMTKNGTDYWYGYFAYSGGNWVAYGNGDISIVNQTLTSITFCNNAGGAKFGAYDIEYIILESSFVASNSDFDGYEMTYGIARWECFVEGTKITLADGTLKNVEDITSDDKLLVWNFYEGKLDTANICWLMPKKFATQYHKVTLSDGTIMKLVGPGEKCHRLFNVDKQQMLYANECVGYNVYKQDGTIAKVLSCETVDDSVYFYNLTTEKYIDCFAEGVLTGSRLNNMYHISDMKYDSDVRLISEEEEAERWAVRGMETPKW